MLIRWRILRTMSRLRPRKRRVEISDSPASEARKLLRAGYDIVVVSFGRPTPQCFLRLQSAHCHTNPCEQLAEYINRLSSQGLEVRIEGPQEDVEPCCNLCPLYKGVDLSPAQAEPLRLPIELSQIGNAKGRVLGESHDVSPIYAPAQDFSEYDVNQT